MVNTTESLGTETRRAVPVVPPAARVQRSVASLLEARRFGGGGGVPLAPYRGVGVAARGAQREDRHPLRGRRPARGARPARGGAGDRRVGVADRGAQRED